MGESVYKLVVDLSTRGSLAPAMEKVGSQAKNLDGMFSKIGDTVGSIGGKLSDAFTGAVETVGALALKVAALGATAGIGAVTYGVVSLNAELEKTQTSLGALFAVNGKADGMTQGIQLAGDVMKQMRRDAAELPGEFSDLLGFFRLGSTPGFQAGASVKDMEKLSANAMATSASLGMDMHQASREFAMLLQGRAGAHNVFGSLLGFSGEKAQDFNAKSADQRLTAVTAALGQYEASRKAFANTFDALSSTLIDNGKRFLGTATAGVFDKVKVALREANEWFDKNDSLVNSWGEAIGSRLGRAFDVAKGKLLEWGPVLLDFGKSLYAEFQKIEAFIMPVLAKVEPLLKGVARNPTGGIENTAMLYGAAKLAKPLMSAAPEVGISAPMAALAAAGIAIDIWAISLARQTNVGERHWQKMTDHMSKAGESFSKAFDKLAPSFERLGQTIGTLLITEIEASAWALEGLAKGFAWLADTVSKMGAAFDNATAMFRSKVKLKDDDFSRESMEDIAKRWTFELGPSLMAGAAAMQEAAQAKENKRPSVTGGGGTSIQKVEIVVSSNQDPDRIARLTVDKLAQISRYPTSSRNVKNFGANRP